MIRCVAAVDCGTTATKCALLDLDGRTLAAVSQLAAVLTTPDGGFSLDADALLDTVLNGLAACVADPAAAGAEILGCAVTGQRATVVCVDGCDRPLGPALSWQDMRGAPELAALRQRLPDDAYFRLTGLPNFPVFTLAKLLWVRAHEPQRDQRTRRYALLSDFILHGLGAAWATDTSNASLTGLLDVSARQWSDALFDLAGLDPKRFGTLVEPGTRIGALSPCAAKRTGLPAGLPLIAGAGDQQCAGLGAGVIAPGAVEITLGTVAVPLCADDRPVLDPQRRITCGVHAAPGLWHGEGLQQAAGACLVWLARLLSRGAASRFEPDAWDAAGRLPPGADGLLFQPYLLGAGSPRWNAAATGGLLGLRERHGPAHLLRATLEGIACENRAILDVFRELGVPVRDVRLTGSGSLQPVWSRIQAGLYGVPVVTLENPQATLVGAAALAACGTGVYASAAEAVRHMVRFAQRFEPDAAEQPACAALYARYAEVRRRFDAANLWDPIGRMA